MTSVVDDLDNLSLDWDDLSEVGPIATELLARLAADRPAMAELIDRMLSSEHLLAQCEHHRLLDRLVLHDALDRGVRLRLHFSTDDHLDRPHDHRFSFATRVVRGRYRHVRHRIVGDLAPALDVDVQEDRDAVPTAARAEPLLVTDEHAGSSYLLHHTEVHTTVTTRDTVSIFLRGPAEKDRSLISDRATGRVWWRYGADEEPAERRARKRMPRESVEALCDRARAFGLA